jgi:hypothetical protein
VKILDVVVNKRRKCFDLRTEKGRYTLPFAKLHLRPNQGNRVVEVYPDQEAGAEAFTYRLQSGDEDTVHLDVVLEYHQDPTLMNELFLHRLTMEARKAVEESDLSKRELIRALGTSPSQFYRLLDPSYYGKSIGQMAALLRLVDREVEVLVRERVAPEFRSGPT